MQACDGMQRDQIRAPDVSIEVNEGTGESWYVCRECHKAIGSTVKPVEEYGHICHVRSLDGAFAER